MALGKRDLERILKNPAGKQTMHSHEMGLALRESAKGVLTWQGKYTFEGKQHRIDYGRFPEMPLRKAEDAHADTRQLIIEGIDPKLERNQETVSTVADLCREWLDKYARHNRTRLDIPQREIKADINPSIGHIKLSIMKVRHVNQCLDPIMARGSKPHARKILGLLRQICAWGVRRGYLQDDPTASLKKSEYHAPKPRERYLSGDEIATVWQKLPNLGLSVQVVLATKILLLTGQRRNEITLSEWRHLDLDKGVWLMPKTKNGSDHTIPLSGQVIELFKQLKEYSNGSKYVMPSPKGDKPMSEKVITRAIARKQDDFDIEHWTPHDLRRTAISGMNAIGIMPHVVEMLVNHSLPDMLRVYVHGKQDSELFEMQRDALERWAKCVRGAYNG
ncbi:tyrosine-type recombinase/integrase [Vibrio agarivorans]|uniref:Tyrosine-type recombinase/integrase n=1 Tax=Vibrio agarivorans TaxID=153622 RepID=A0ABT7Y0U7_9VIBR|nr:site-specific integrase [Vibrio agarivorans]MDN2481659.1 tyrosine-type recombinase/integrase [Vibrio agarivorans]